MYNAKVSLSTLTSVCIGYPIHEQGRLFSTHVGDNEGLYTFANTATAEFFILANLSLVNMEKDMSC